LIVFAKRVLIKEIKKALIYKGWGGQKAVRLLAHSGEGLRAKIRDFSDYLCFGTNAAKTQIILVFIDFFSRCVA
jgi:hypothetical protein